MKQTTVALLFGGRSREYEISCRSAATVLTALREAGYRVLPIGITRQGEFLLYRGGAEQIQNTTWESSAANTPLWLMPHGSVMTADGRSLHIDVVFPCLHGQYGEDGRIQGFLDALDLPYIGCGTAASVRAWDKALSKACAVEIGVPTLPWVVTPRAGAEEAILRKLSFPLFIKPVLSGSSIGAGRADDRATLTRLLDSAAEVGGDILAEPCITARELEVAVLSDGETIISRVGEVTPNSTFYDYDTKYRADTARTYIPARLDQEAAEQIRSYARRIYEALGCRHLARVDFFRDAHGIYFNEINTMPGFTSISMYPMLMQDCGIPLPALVGRLVEAARR